MAYLTAKTNGLDDVALDILEAAGLTEADVDDVPSFGKSTLAPPPVVSETTSFNWPSLATGESFFDKALANGNLEGGDVPYLNGVDGGAAASAALDEWARMLIRFWQWGPRAGRRAGRAPGGTLSLAWARMAVLRRVVVGTLW